MSATGSHVARLALHEGATETVAAVYNQAGDDYAAYADGHPTNYFPSRASTRTRIGGSGFFSIQN